jgi:hypothetical protein
MSEKAMPDDDSVMELFGFKVKVSNPRLAEVLRMDAKAALTSDVRQLLSPEQKRQQQADLAQAMPDAVVAEQTSRDIRDVTRRSGMRGRADAIAGALGFDADADGSWRSSSGFNIRTRLVDDAVSPATAADAVSKLAPLFNPIRTDESVLFIVEGEGSATSYFLAIRQQRAHAWARMIRLSDLEALRSLRTTGVADHELILSILCAVMSADAGVLVSGLVEALSSSELE